MISKKKEEKNIVNRIIKKLIFLKAKNIKIRELKNNIKKIIINAFGHSTRHVFSLKHIICIFLKKKYKIVTRSNIEKNYNELIIEAKDFLIKITKQKNLF